MLDCPVLMNVGQFEVWFYRAFHDETKELFYYSELVMLLLNWKF